MLWLLKSSTCSRAGQPTNLHGIQMQSSFVWEHWARCGKATPGGPDGISKPGSRRLTANLKAGFWEATCILLTNGEGVRKRERGLPQCEALSSQLWEVLLSVSFLRCGCEPLGTEHSVSPLPSTEKTLRLPTLPHPAKPKLKSNYLVWNITTIQRHSNDKSNFPTAWFVLFY